jgi:glucose-6-phosphate 1-dehydrogenase
MSELDCDGLVFFGATGDLAYKKIFPALQAMVRRGTRECRASGRLAESGHFGSVDGRDRR